MSAPIENSGGNREAIEATAGVWLSLRDRGMTPRETEAFVHWLQEDPQHASVFASLEQAWQQVDQLLNVVTPGAATDPDTLAPRYRRRVRRLPLVALAAAAAFAVLLFGVWNLRSSRHFAETAVGAFQRVDLPDGSVAQLNTDSALDVDMSRGERRVAVVRGEVHFAVHKDANRPFIVAARDIKVRAVGTAFDVRSSSNSTEVTVTEGRVQVTNTSTGETVLSPKAGTSETPTLGAGERLVIAAGATGANAETASLTRLNDAELRRVLAWQERRLEFDDTPLRDVVAEFNRYNRIKLTVVSARLSARPFSGTFRVDGYEALVALLEENFGVVAQRQGDEIQLVDK